MKKKLFFLALFVMLAFSLLTLEASAKFTASDVASALKIDEAKAESMLADVGTKIKARTATIDLSSYGIEYYNAAANNAEALSTILAYFRQDPDYYMISMAFKYGGSSTDGGATWFVSHISPNYLMTKKQCDDVESAISTIIGDLKDNTALSDLEKALLVHDRLAVLCEYDTSYLNRSVYNVLIDQTSVCEGYAETYKLLMNRLDIETRTVSSNTLNHEWNIVTLDGKEYHVDVTHDDPTKDMIGRVTHKNFLVSTTTLKTMPSSSHIANDYDSSPTDTTYDTALWRSINSSFVLADDGVYFLDYDTDNQCVVLKQLVVTSDSVSSVKVADFAAQDDNIWQAGGGSYYPNFSSCGLASDGDLLFFNLSKTIYSYDPESDTLAEIASDTDLTLGDYNLYGLRYRDGVFDYIVRSTANSDDIVRKYDPSAAPAAVFDSQSLTLDGDLGVNIYMILDDAAKADGSYMEFTVSGKGGKTVKVYTADVTPEADGRYKFTCNVSVIQLADTVTATYHYGSESVTKNCSVKAYLQRLVQTTSDENDKAIARKLMNYAHYAQEALSEANGWTVGVDYAPVLAYNLVPVTATTTAPYPQPVTTVDLSSYAYAESGTRVHVTDIKRSLVLGTRTDIVLYITTDGEVLEKGSNILFGGDYTVEAQGSNVYRVVLRNIAADQLGTDYTVIVDGTDTITLSALTYADLVLKNPGSSDSLKLAVAALYEYYLAAVSYTAA